jgi:serine protease AprX
MIGRLTARLQRARPGEPVDVLITFRVPFEQVNFPLIQAQLGAFGPAQPLRLARSVATRLTRNQIAALSRAGIVEQLQEDEPMVAFRASAMKWFGVTAAHEEIGLTGDGDGDVTAFTFADNTIAIVDSGIDSTHVELDGGKVIGWRDLVNNRTLAYDDDGHGTHVASIAAGKPVNGSAGGVAPGAALVGVKVLDSRGSAPTSRVAQGIDWCVQNRDGYGIRVINLSLGSSSSSDGTDVVSRSVDAAVAAGITVVCAAGNSGSQTLTVGSPAAARGAIAVGAVADPDRGGIYVASWSSRGPTRDGRIKPDIMAPGVGIVAAKANSHDLYVAFSGTSMASPFVAGFVSLMLQAAPKLTPADIYRDITETARDRGLEGPDSDFGYGLLDGVAALQPFEGRTAGSISPPFPAHLSQAGAISADVPSAQHAFEVSSTAYPIAVALIIGNWSRGTPDFDMELLDPEGKRVARSNSASRQETVSWRPQVTGTYTLRVFGFRSQDRGSYYFDLSTDLAPLGPPPSVAPPATGITP